MKIPKKIKIGAHVVNIDCSKELPGRSGEWVQKTNTILICKTLPETQREATLLHEIFHCINTTFGESQYHAFMDSFCEQIYQVLKDNKFLK